LRIKTINGLMMYLRDKKSIAIAGSNQKKKLKNIGYYHGYKGYRFYRKPSDPLNFSNFDELMAVYDFDMQIKSVFYSRLMFIETALKNRVLESILIDAQSEKFADVYSRVLNHHNDLSPSSRDFTDAIKRELSFRNRVYCDLARDYNTRLLVKHYYEKDKPVPIWAIFETLSLGEFGNMLRCVNDKTMHRISKELKMNTAFDADGRLLQMIVFTLKDLRNAVAHNDPVFDTRFCTATPNQRISKMLAVEAKTRGISFSTVTDYVILMAYLMKQLSVSKTEIRRFLSEYTKCCEELRNKVPTAIFTTIVHTDTRGKISSLLSSL